MANAPSTLMRPRGFGETMRTDSWWTTPAFYIAAFSSFLIYGTWAAYQNEFYTFGPYISPFYSPEIYGASHHAWFGPKPSWWPEWIRFSPSLLILWAPGGFRFTCYYYRGSYYKAFWQDPPACAVGEPRHGYKGENSFPLILQNVHRYFLYIAILFIFILAYDTWLALWFPNPDGTTSFGIGVGTIVLAVNAVLLGGYTLGCHAARHLFGGFLDTISSRPANKLAYDCVSCLNSKHGKWALASMFSVMFADFYVRMCSMGIWTDLRLL
jgi:hypothetical protein